MNQKERIEEAIEALRLTNEWISLHWSTGFGDIIERNIAAIGVLSALATPQPEVSDREIAAVDLFWCTLGCGFVDENHRCEQWGGADRIPKEAVSTIRSDERRKAADNFVALFNAALDVAKNLRNASDESLNLVMSDPFCNRMKESMASVLHETNDRDHLKRHVENHAVEVIPEE